MTKQLLVSCLAASFLLSGAAIAPTLAAQSDQVNLGKYIYAEGDQNEQAPQEEQEKGDRDSHLINTPTSFDVAQSEGAEGEQPKPEEGGEGGGGGGD
jgi:hypothetical protein